MNIKSLSSVIALIVFMIALSSCNLPNRQEIASPTQTAISAPESIPTPSSGCTNPYFPSAVGDKWEYSGSDSIVGVYHRTDTITSVSADSFTQDANLGNLTYSVTYDCTSSGLTSRNPIQQYGGALLNNPDVPVNVKLTSNSGISLPAKINPGDTWQQVADWDATSQQLNVNGRFVFDYTAVGYEDVTVAAGSYNALRVSATIHVEVTSFHVSAGTYTIVSWWVPEVGIVKSQGTSHVTGINFNDNMDLTSFTPAP